ncbi:hypothetical protein K1W54_28750 [Micromonospora sp. CPCC 205371]|nr:hypothetical protein [Micromonospora sp. CPCC 205371]
MSTVAEADAALTAAIQALPKDEIRLHPDVGAAVDPPAAVVGPPALLWEGACLEPTTARFLVYVIVSPDAERAKERLYALVPMVANALDQVTDASVIRADPGRYPTSDGDLPAYEIQVDVAL